MGMFVGPGVRGDGAFDPYCCTPHILEAAGPLMKLQLPPSDQVGTCAGLGTFGMSTDSAEDHQVKNYPHKTLPRPLC